jgi:hypothetical protein
MERVSIVVTCRNGVTKNKFRQHNVTMIGNSFLRGIRENVELSLNNKLGIYSMVKPGCDLNNLLESAKSVFRKFNPQRCNPHLRKFK